MKLPSINLGKPFVSAAKGQVHFGAVTPSFGNSKLIKHIADCQANELVTRVTNNIKNAASSASKKLLVEKGGELFPAKGSQFNDFAHSFVELAHIPQGLLASFSQTMHKKFGLFGGLYNSKFVQNYFNNVQARNNFGTLRGVYEIGEEVLSKAKSSASNCACGKDSSACTAFSDKLAKLLNQSMEWGKPNYATKDERFWTRIISGFMAGGFMSMDFLNKAKMQGKDDKQAKKDSNKKLSQEMLANLGEAAVQFVFIATFAKLANTKLWVAGLVSAGAGFAFNIISRLATGMPLHRIKSPDVPLSVSDAPISAAEFAKQAKEDKLNTVRQPMVHSQSEKQDKTKSKKPILSIKNIFIACGISIAGGFALAFAKKKIPDTQLFKTLKAKFNASSVGKLINKKISDIAAKMADEAVSTNQGELTLLNRALYKSGEKELSFKIDKVAQKIFEEKGETAEILLGKEPVKHLLFGKIEVPKKKLYELPLAPLRFVKNVISFPYDQTKKVIAALKGLKTNKGADVIEKFNIEDVKNIVLRFREFKKKFPNEEDLIREFGQYVQKMREISTNSTTASKINNADISIIAQTLGMLAGINFNMNDDYNQTIRNGGTVEQAQKDGRKRGINKFIRTSVQAIIAGVVLNKTFAKQYNSSLIKAGAITAIATILTDITCRFLTGMPFTKMNKEEQIAYEERQLKGPAGWYFKFVDKLAS